ncbi:MAG: pilus assembly protein [Burkholderiales bacterium]|nr:pilus assembly protein [Burkholderiales bacterium]
MTTWNWRERGRAATIHFGLSMAVAIAAALLVFLGWYPYPYREISGGRELFLILVTVDVVIGPLITLMIFDRAKPWKELRRDLAVVALLQAAALVYGLYTVSLARPVHLVFEIDRFRVVSAAEVPEDMMDKVPPGIDTLPLFGPTLLAVRPFRNENERIEATMVALQGISLSARPDLWQSFPEALPRVLAAARPVADLKGRHKSHAGEIDAVLAQAGRRADNTAWLPLVGRKSFWTAFIDPANGQPVAFLPLDPY